MVTGRKKNPMQKMCLLSGDLIKTQNQVLVKSVNSDCLKSANWLSATWINRLQIGAKKLGKSHISVFQP